MKNPAKMTFSVFISPISIEVWCASISIVMYGDPSLKGNASTEDSLDDLTKAIFLAHKTLEESLHSSLQAFPTGPEKSTVLWRHQPKYGQSRPSPLVNENG